MALSQSEGKILIDIMYDHDLEQLVHFPSRQKNTLDLILTYLPGQFQDIHSPDKLSDHDIVSGTMKGIIPPLKKLQGKVYPYQKDHFESMRKDTFEFAMEKYFSGHSDTRSVQENFDQITSFIQDSTDKHIPSKTSRSTEMGLHNRILKRQRNLMVNLRMCSIKMNTPRSRFWIGLPISWTILLFLKTE